LFADPALFALRDLPAPGELSQELPPSAHCRMVKTAGLGALPEERPEPSHERGLVLEPERMASPGVQR
jgi:hypothetical protein